MNLPILSITPTSLIFLLDQYEDLCPNCLDEEAKIEIYESQLMLVVNAHMTGIDFQKGSKELEILREYLQLDESYCM